MKYLVMECHPAYAIVLGEDGRFCRVANMHYQVGQQLDEVFGLEQPKGTPVVIWKKAAEIVAAAACFCLILLGMWQMVLVPCGTVRMQINPDIAITVNRLDYVTSVKGLNEDGKQVVQGYSSSFKKLDTVTDQLADRSVEMGYLEDGGRITLTVESDREKWKTATEERLLLELEVHFDYRVIVEISPSGADTSDDAVSDSMSHEIVIPVPSPDLSGSDILPSDSGDDNDDMDDADDIDDQTDSDDLYEDDGMDDADDIDDQTDSDDLYEDDGMDDADDIGNQADSDDSYEDDDMNEEEDRRRMFDNDDGDFEDDDWDQDDFDDEILEGEDD